ncbi:hypothetical protein F8M41_007804 [Gigaspora margarita]|uniref:Uncharacterized protein n=1 Tax=Gigaspora margarita TaxID=4874 RepID=A0A8H4B4H8_GIGMA|nr:hypothetical protein F8M41_007804 [Gigaspora margarita]
MPYNLVFGQLPHSETNLADILINDNYDQEEPSNTSAILETNNDNKSYDYLFNILDIYYDQNESYNNNCNQIELYDRNPDNSFSEDFESRLNLEGSIISDDYNLKGSIISDDYNLEDSIIPNNFYSKDLKTRKTQSEIIEVDNDLVESNNNLIDANGNVMNLQEIIIISDSESQSYTTQEKQKWRASTIELQKTTSNSTRPIFEQHNKIRQAAFQILKKIMKLLKVQWK